MAAAPVLNPWDRRADEPAEAYARFLVYLYLGPVRSLDAAYKLYVPKKAAPKAAKGSKKQQPPERDARRASGQWNEDSVHYQWPERAVAWDIATLTEHGQRSVVNFVAAIEAAAQKVLEALSDPKVKPKSWEQALEAINTIGTLIPPQTVAAVLDYASTLRSPSSGGNGAGPAVTERAGTDGPPGVD